MMRGLQAFHTVYGISHSHMQYKCWECDILLIYKIINLQEVFF